MKHINLWNYIEQAGLAETPEALFELFKNTLNSLGIDQVVYSLLTEHKSVQKKAKHALFSGYSEDWMKYYLEKDYENVDPAIKFMLTQSGFFQWDNLEQDFRKLTKKERTLMHEADDAGLKTGAGISLFNGRSEICGMGFANSNGDIDWNDNNMQSVVYMIASHFHMAYLELLKDNIQNNQTIKLAPREEEIIKWLAYGKNIPETAVIMGRSVNTIKTNIKNACKKLDCYGTRALIAKAIYLGLIRINI